LNKNIPVYFSKKGCLKLFFSTITGLLPFVHFKESYLEIIMPNYILKQHSLTLPFPIKAALYLGKM
jgi:hypothetical protein